MATYHPARSSSSAIKKTRVSMRRRPTPMVPVRPAGPTTTGHRLPENRQRNRNARTLCRTLNIPARPNRRLECRSRTHRISHVQGIGVLVRQKTKNTVHSLFVGATTDSKAPGTFLISEAHKFSGNVSANVLRCPGSMSKMFISKPYVAAPVTPVLERLKS